MDSFVLFVSSCEPRIGKPRQVSHEATKFTKTICGFDPKRPPHPIESVFLRELRVRHFRSSGFRSQVSTLSDFSISALRFSAFRSNQPSGFQVSALRLQVSESIRNLQSEIPSSIVSSHPSLSSVCRFPSSALRPPITFSASADWVASADYQCSQPCIQVPMFFRAIGSTPPPKKVLHQRR